MTNIAGSDTTIKEVVAQEADRLRRDSALEEKALIDVEAINATLSVKRLACNCPIRMYGWTFLKDASV